jgi:hypothetical protein
MRHVACTDKKSNAYSILLGNSEGKRPLGRPDLKREYNIKINLREVGRVEMAQSV